MSNEFQRLLDDGKKALQGRPGQPLLLGVCAALARRLDMEAWLVRVGVILLFVLFNLVTLVVYLVLALVLEETAERSRKIFHGLWMTIKEKFEPGRSAASRSHHP